MRHRTRHLRNIGMAKTLLWTALVVMPSLALAGGLPSSSLGVRPTQAGTHTAPVRQDLVTVCQQHCQATSTSLDAVRAQIQAAQTAHDPAQLRTILGEVLQQQTAIEGHLAICMATMGIPR